MSQVSKKKFWEALKKEPDKEHSIFEIFKKPITQEEWLKGYKPFLSNIQYWFSIGFSLASIIILVLGIAEIISIAFTDIF